jgi:hypothetical protein
MDERRLALEAEQRQLSKDLKRERASLRRLAGEQSRNGVGATSRLAAVQERVETIEGRLVAVAQDLNATKRQTIDERHVATALSTFDSVWEVLIPTEQARVLALMTEGIVCDGRTGNLELALRPSGIGKLHEIPAS